nr:hypothetical protein Iba_chr13fCG6000 [Ipomoea batatas]
MIAQHSSLSYFFSLPTSLYGADSLDVRCGSFAAVDLHCSSSRTALEGEAPAAAGHQATTSSKLAAAVRGELDSNSRNSSRRGGLNGRRRRLLACSSPSSDGNGGPCGSSSILPSEQGSGYCESELVGVDNVDDLLRRSPCSNMMSGSDGGGALAWFLSST